MSEVQEIISRLRQGSTPGNVEKMKRFGITADRALGTPVPVVRKIARDYRKRHDLALELWNTGIHEARILATIVEDPEKVTMSQARQWVRELNSWDTCDQLCMNLLEKTVFVRRLVTEFAGKKREFEKRSAFSIIAAYAVHRKKATDDEFVEFMKLIKDAADDERNFVKKAVSWALRSIGKRNEKLRTKSVALARELKRSDNKASQWIANDVIRELESSGVKKKFMIDRA